METVSDFILGGSKITADGVYSHDIQGHFLLGNKGVTDLDSVLKKQRCHFVDKDLYSQSYSFSNRHVQMLKVDHKEG